MDLPPANLVAASVLTAYGVLPSRGKPSVRPNGVHEWTVLAGFSLASLAGAAHWDVQCIALGTGMKALPFEKLPKQGDVLHDSHAEIIARRGLLLYLYQQIVREDGCLVREDGGWRLRSGMVLCMYVSTLPCGDASMYSLSLLAPPSPDISPIDPVDPIPLLASTLLATSLGLGTSRTSLSTPSVTLRGRTAYSALGSLRTKPGRLDSKPTISHSCSDKLAVWNVAGIQGGLLSSLGVELRVGFIVVGGVEEDSWERVEVEVRRALGGRVGRGVNVAFTDKVFRDGGREIEGVVSCSDSLSWVKGERSEVIVNGMCGGATLKRKGLDALSWKSRSRLSKLSLFETFLRTAALLDIPIPPSTTYFEAKRLPLSSSYQLSKSTLQSPTAPFAGWITSGLPFESFVSTGRLL